MRSRIVLLALKCEFLPVAQIVGEFSPVRLAVGVPDSLSLRHGDWIALEADLVDLGGFHLCWRGLH